MVAAADTAQNIETFTNDILMLLHSEARYEALVDREFDRSIEDGLESITRDVLNTFDNFELTSISSEREDIPLYGVVGIRMKVSGLLELARSEIIPIQLIAMVRRKEHVAIRQSN